MNLVLEAHLISSTSEHPNQMQPYFLFAEMHLFQFKRKKKQTNLCNPLNMSCYKRVVYVSFFFDFCFGFLFIAKKQQTCEKINNHTYIIQRFPPNLTKYKTQRKIKLNTRT